MNKVQIEALTKPINPKLTIEDFVAYVARVSNPSNQANTLTAKKLLKFLAKNKHWSPFEMVSVTMEINTTRDIARQILRHRSFSFQEFSQRYADVSAIETAVSREPRLQDTKNRQNSLDIDYNDDGQRQLSYQWEILQQELVRHSKSVYAWALEKGLAKEQARAVLPEGLTMSRLYVAGTLRSWMHYCVVRMDPSTQKEHREIAQLAWAALLEHFPSIAELVPEC